MKEKFKLWFLPLLFKCVLTVLTLTCKVRWQNKQTLDDLEAQNDGFILSFWHENVLIIPWLLRNRGFYCMVSDSRDGEYIARIGLTFGNKIVRGSSSKGATKATRTALRVIKQRGIMAITPDGPRGPAHQLQTGVLWLGALSGAAILPFHIEVDRQWRFRSWDGQKIPKPFSTIHVSVGEPLRIDRADLQESVEETTAEIQAAMMQNTNSARVAAGYEAI